MIIENYICSFLLIVFGLYTVLVKKNLIKIVIGLSLIDYGINLLIVSVGFKTGGTAPIFTLGEIKPETFFLLMKTVSTPKAGATVLTMELENPFGYGRIIRDTQGDLLKIVEEKDALPSQKAIREVNTGTYVFHADLLFKGLKTVTTENAQREYYLPDAFTYIRNEGYTVKIHKLTDPIEGSGINSKDELSKLEHLL